MKAKQELILYYKPGCPFCKKVLDALDEVGKSLPLKSTFDLENKEEFKQRAPKIQVPCLFIDDKSLYESDAIIKWIKKNLDLLSPARDT